MLHLSLCLTIKPVDKVKRGTQKTSKEHKGVIVDMAHRQRVERLIEELGQQGMGYYTVAPPLFWLLWALGLEIPTPLFLGFRKLTLLMGTFLASCGVLCGESVCSCGHGKEKS
jgi:hypothetical protein